MNLESHLILTRWAFERFGEKIVGLFGMPSDEFIMGIYRNMNEVDRTHHAFNSAQRKWAWYCIMYARELFLAAKDGLIDTKNEATRKDFYEYLLAAMHLYQDSVIFPKDENEHISLEMVAWETLSRENIDKLIAEERDSWKYKMLGGDPFRTARLILREWYFNTGMIARYGAGISVMAALLSRNILLAVSSERVLDSTTAEKLLIECRLMEYQSERGNFGDEMRQKVFNRIIKIKKNIKFAITAIILNALFALMAILGIKNPTGVLFYGVGLYAFTSLVLLPPLIPVLLVLRVVLPWRIKKKSRELKIAEIMDEYPTHAFFDAPYVYLENIGMRVGHREKKEIVKKV